MTESREQLEQRCKKAETEATLFAFIAHALMKGEKPAAVETFAFERGHYAMSLWQPDGTHGGFVSELRQHDGQRPVLDVYYLDCCRYAPANDRRGAAPVEFQRAIRNLTMARDAKE